MSRNGLISNKTVHLCQVFIEFACLDVTGDKVRCQLLQVRTLHLLQQREHDIFEKLADARFRWLPYRQFDLVFEERGRAGKHSFTQQESDEVGIESLLVRRAAHFRFFC